MSNLRQAAEMALKYFEDAHGLEDEEVAIKEALRQALDLQTAIEKGTKAWADVPDATKWVEELRGSDTPAINEPVAWADKVGAVIPHSHKLFQPALLKDYTRPLYTAPPKKEWVGLTEEDFYKKDDETVFVLGMKFAEARLKEKNT